MKRAADAIELDSFDKVMAKLDVSRGELRVGFKDADRRGLNRFMAMFESLKRLEAGQKRLMSMVDEQFDGLMQALVD